MADRLTRQKRSEVMSRIRAKNTKPELAVRSMVHRLGYRFRLHARNLPGSPDLVFAARKKAIFVHGCFWHWHEGCRVSKIPKTRTAFWASKLKRNRERDVRKETELKELGWRYLVVWECELRNPEQLRADLLRFLRG